MRAVVHIQLPDAQTGNSCGGKLTLCMQHLDFLLSRHPAQSILHTLLDGSLRVQITWDCGLRIQRCRHHYKQREEIPFLHHNIKFG